MTLPNIYTNEEKILAYKRLRQDPRVKFYTNQINIIQELWSYPQKIILGETVISEKLLEMPKDLIDKYEFELSEYLNENYPELPIIRQLVTPSISYTQH